MDWLVYDNSKPWFPLVYVLLRNIPWIKSSAHPLLLQDQVQGVPLRPVCSYSWHSLIFTPTPSTRSSSRSSPWTVLLLFLAFFNFWQIFLIKNCQRFFILSGDGFGLVLKKISKMDNFENICTSHPLPNFDKKKEKIDKKRPKTFWKLHKNYIKTT